MARGCSTQCFQGLHEGYGNVALPYRSGTVDLKCSWKAGLLSMITSIQDNPMWRTIELATSLLDADQRLTACELAAKVKTMLHIMHDILGYCRLSAHLIHYEITEV